MKLAWHSRAAAPRLDFCQPQAPARRVVPWLIGLALGLALVMALQAWETLAQRRASQAQWEEWQARAARRVKPAAATTSGPLAGNTESQAQALRAAQALDRAVHHPWGRLLEAVSAGAPAGVRWLRLEHDAAQGELRLAGRAPSLALALDAVQRLGQQGPFAAVTLTQVANASATDSAVSFELRASLAAAAKAAP